MKNTHRGSARLDAGIRVAVLLGGTAGSLASPVFEGDPLGSDSLVRSAFVVDGEPGSGCVHPLTSNAKRTTTPAYRMALTIRADSHAAD